MEQQEETTVMVEAADIFQLDFRYSKTRKNMMCFSMEVNAYGGMAFIFLRSALKCLGDYKVIKTENFMDEDVEHPKGLPLYCEIHYTNLPVSVFRSFAKKTGDVVDIYKEEQVLGFDLEGWRKINKDKIFQIVVK